MKTFHFLIASLLAFSAYAQQAEQPSANASFSALKEFMPESTTAEILCARKSVYLHLDNTTYMMGDSIRYAAYLLQNDFSRSQQHPDTLFVQLISPKGNVAYNSKLLLTENTSISGHIPTTALDGGGMYEVRAFTSEMHQVDPTDYYSNFIPVFEKRKTSSSQEGKQAIDCSIALRIFPEGGRMVHGIQQRIAFALETKDNTGLMNEFSGWVIDETGNVLADIRSIKDGMGLFTYTPAKGRKAFLRLSMPVDMKLLDFALPECEESGIVPSVRMKLDSIQIGLEHIGLSGKVMIALMKDGTLIWNKEADLSSANAIKYSLPAAILPAGVSNLYVLSPSGSILTYRSVFKHPDGEASPDYSDDYSSSYRLETDTLTGEILVNSVNTNTLSHSIAIRQQSTANCWNSLSINTWYYLMRELRGWVKNANDYFSLPAQNILDNCDLLMLTHGWRQYETTIIGGQTVNRAKTYRPIFKPTMPCTEEYTPVVYWNPDVRIKASQGNIPMETVPKDAKMFRFSFPTTDPSLLHVNAEGLSLIEGKVQIVGKHFANRVNYFMKVVPSENPLERTFQWKDGQYVIQE